MPFVKTRISVSGFTNAEVRDGLPDLIDELRARSWIIHPEASWDSDRERLVVTTHYQGIDADSLSRAAADEVWDCVIACVNFSSDGLHFSIDASSVVQRAEPSAAADGGSPATS
jgi:hypothetical protein